MSDNPSSTSGAPTGASQALDQGGLIPWFEKGKESPNSFSAKDMNRLVKYVRLLQRVSVERRTGAANPDGSYTPLGKFIWSDQKLVLELTDAPGTVSSGGGTVNVVLGRVTSESSEYVTVQPIQATGDGTYSDTGGAAFNVAKPFLLRGFTGSQISPSYTDVTYFRIFAIQAPTGGTGVYVSGIDVGYEDANVDARAYPSIHYRGTYNSSTSYFLGDVVRVQTGTSQGTWICVIGNPTSSHQPTWPEPATTGGTNYWEMFSFGVYAMTTCVGGTKTQYFNANAPS